jgi:predicted nucleic acid-binding protein
MQASYENIGLSCDERCLTARFTLSHGADASALRVALQAAEAGRFKFYDALLLATARGAGCSVVISGDMADGAEPEGGRVIAAFAPDGRMSPDAEALLPVATPD